MKKTLIVLLVALLAISAVFANGATEAKTEKVDAFHIGKGWIVVPLRWKDVSSGLLRACRQSESCWE